MKWWQSFKISFFNAGFISIWDEEWALHLFVFPTYWLFGGLKLKHRAYKKVSVYGFGPLFLFCRTKIK